MKEIKLRDSDGDSIGFKISDTGGLSIKLYNHEGRSLGYVAFYGVDGLDAQKEIVSFLTGTGGPEFVLDLYHGDEE